MTDLPVRVGDLLYGFCDGHFGRDSYADERVEGVGIDWVVARDTDGIVWLAVGANEPEDVAAFRTRPIDWTPS